MRTFLEKAYVITLDKNLVEILNDNSIDKCGDKRENRVNDMLKVFMGEFCYLKMNKKQNNWIESRLNDYCDFLTTEYNKFLKLESKYHYEKTNNQLISLLEFKKGFNNKNDIFVKETKNKLKELSNEIIR